MVSGKSVSKYSYNMQDIIRDIEIKYDSISKESIRSTVSKSIITKLCYSGNSHDAK